MQTQYYTALSTNPILERQIGQYLNTVCREYLQMDKRDSTIHSNDYTPSIAEAAHAISTYLRSNGNDGEHLLEPAQNRLYHALLPQFKPDEKAAIECVRHSMGSTIDFIKDQYNIGQGVTAIPPWPVNPHRAIGSLEGETTHLDQVRTYAHTTRWTDLAPQKTHAELAVHPTGTDRTH